MKIYFVKIRELAELYCLGEKYLLAIDSIADALKSTYILNREELKNFVKGISNE
jgi:hypothetical protein